jgi:hypothetical protein
MLFLFDVPAALGPREYYVDLSLLTSLALKTKLTSLTLKQKCGFNILQAQ